MTSPFDHDISQHQIALTEKELFTIKCALSKQISHYIEISEKTGLPIKPGTQVEAMVKTSTFLLDTLP
jgi:hypothetical protein